MIRKQGSAPTLTRAVVLLAGFFAACGFGSTGQDSKSQTSLTVGIGPLPSASPQDGLRQLIQIISLESLVRFAEDGRPQPGLASSWTVSPNQLSAKLTLRDGVTFHDGTAVTASEISKSLESALPRAMGPASADVSRLTAPSNAELDFELNQPSPFLLEALEATVQKPGAKGVGTGPYIPGASGESTEMVANRRYYLGRPHIDRLVLNTYATTRAAWADMLRGRVDMLYEVGVDALDSLKGASNVKLFKFTRHYQMMIVFNPDTITLTPAVRMALNNAIDREALINEALDGFAEPSFGPIWPHHWAYPAQEPGFRFDAAKAVQTLPAAKTSGVRLRFTCLVPQGAPYERVALVVKRQLERVGVDVDLQQVPLDELVTRLPKHEYQAALVEGVNAPTMFRPYEWWHSGGSLNIGRWGNRTLDEALDRLRHCGDATDYKIAVESVHRAAMANPPAIFLAWGQRARAVSTRFIVPSESDREVLQTLRLWKPAAGEQAVSRN